MTFAEGGSRGSTAPARPIRSTEPTRGSGAETAPTPAVTFLTTVYRTEAYLPETIESVRAQTSPDWEHVIVDNGMSDEVVEIVGRYGHDPRIRLIRKENEGYAPAIDAAAAVARGRIFAVLDSDDLLAPHYCERMTGQLDAHPEIDALGPDAYTFIDGGHRRLLTHFQALGYWRRPRVAHRLTLADVLAGYQPSDCAAVRREAWFAIGGYSEAVSKVEDLSTYLRLIQAGYDVRAVPDRLISFRFREDSTSRDPTRIHEFAHSVETALRQAAQQSGRREDLRAAAKRIRSTRATYAMRRAGEALQDNDTATASREAREALRYRPTARTAVVVALLALAPDTLKTAHTTLKRLVTAAARGAQKLKRS